MKMLGHIAYKKYNKNSKRPSLLAHLQKGNHGNGSTNENVRLDVLPAL